tara:strand:+ start:1326 stop:1616 length:291 start_codon:yes stop_codon:yes gene_type:complete
MKEGSSSALVGNALVFTSDNGGHTPEQMAEMALNKIMIVSSSAPPVIRDQAIEYRGKLKEVLVLYLNKMAENERTTILALLDQQGQSDMADIIRRL